MVDPVAEELLRSSPRIAVVGMSRDPRKDAHTVPRYLLEQGIEVVPVNPFADEILGQRAYDDVADVPGSLDLVAVFRPGPATPAHVERALEAGARGIWLPLGVRSARSRELAHDAGVPYVEDVCLRVAHRRVLGGT